MDTDTSDTEAALETLANRAVGLEQQIIELVHRRRCARRVRGRIPPDLDDEIARLQDELAELAWRLAHVTVAIHLRPGRERSGP